MPTMSQFRDVPDDLHRNLKARAALERLSLSGRLLQEVRRGVTGDAVLASGPVHHARIELL